MKATTVNFDTEKNKETGAALRTLLEIDATGGTLYHSDQDLSVDAQDYSGVVLNWGEFVAQAVEGEEVQRFSEMSLTLSNFPRIDHLIDVAQEVRVYIWFAGLATADKLLIYKGVISEGISFDFTQISFTTIDIGDIRNKMVGTPLSLGDFPLADPDDVGKIQPLGYGTVVDHQCLAIDAGGVSTITSDIPAGASTIPVLDNTRFPSSGTLMMGEEDDVTWSGKSGTALLTGVANVSKQYKIGTPIFEKKDLKFMVVGHPCKSISNPRILPYGLNKKHAVAILVSDFTVNTDDGGIGTVTITDVLRTLRSVVLAVIQQSDQPMTRQANQPITTQGDQPITEQPSTTVSIQPIGEITVQPESDLNTPNHAHTTNQVVLKPLIGTSDSGDFTSRSNARDENDLTFASGATVFGDNQKNIIISGFDTTDRGTIVNAKAVIKRTSFAVVGSYSANISAPGTGWSQSLSETTVAQIQKFSTGLTNWSDLNDLQFLLIGGLGGTDQVVGSCFEMFWEIEYTPSIDTTFLDPDRTTDTEVDRTTDTEVDRTIDAVSDRIVSTESIRITDAISDRIVDAAIGGNSAADILGGVLIVDVEGYEDDGAGHYTGTPNALIEKPWDVFHHLLENFGNGITDSDIDLAGSFTDTAANLPSTYKFDFTIINRISLNRLLAALSIQTFCRFFWDAGLAKLVDIKSTGTSIKSLDLDDDSIMSGDLPTVRIDQVGISAIHNDIEVLYALDTTMGVWQDKNAYSLISQDSDSLSVSTYGSRTKAWRFFAVRDTTHADDVRDKLLAYFKDPYRTLSFTTFLTNIELERGDLVKAGWDKLGFEGTLHEVIGVNYTPPANSFPLLKYFLKSFLGQEFTRTDNITIADVVSKIDIDMPFSENVVLSEVLKIDIDMPFSENVTSLDILGFVYSAFYFDSALYFDSARIFNEPPP